MTLPALLASLLKIVKFNLPQLQKLGAKVCTSEATCLVLEINLLFNRIKQDGLGCKKAANEQSLRSPFERATLADTSRCAIGLRWAGQTVKSSTAAQISPTVEWCFWPGQGRTNWQLALWR